MSDDQDLNEKKVALVAELEDLEFELFAVQQGHDPQLQERLQNDADLLAAEIGQLDSELASRGRQLSATRCPVASMSQSAINAQFDELTKLL